MFRLFVAIIFALFVSNVVSHTIASNGRINPALLETLTSKGSANIIVRMSDGVQQIIDQVNRVKFDDRGSKLTMMKDSLKNHAEKSQAEVLQVLTNSNSNLKVKYEYHSLWISNEVFIAGADLDLINQLSQLPGIREIHEEHISRINTPKSEPKSRSGVNPDAFLEDGIKTIEADRVWAEFGNNGAGVIVSTIDTGVRWTHDILVGNFALNYGWFDPVLNQLIPNDNHGHGTHVMGTIVGSLTVGVAPGATWMTCRACFYNEEYHYLECPQSFVTRCAQFITCPTLADGSAPDCSKAPHLVSNSFGEFMTNWFDSSIQVWKAVGIVPIFAVGGSTGGNPQCGRTDSPSDSLVGVISVGATTMSDEFATLISSYGPSKFGEIKPDLTAPGTPVKSASYLRDDEYEARDGTGMAAAHVAGVVALMKSEKPDLSYYDLTGLLFRNTNQTTLISTEKNCGDVLENVFPNNAFGWGRVNAYKVIQALRNSE